jgi:hypothetical protein
LLVTRRNEPEFRRFYEYGFDRRPGEELYDLREDPDQLRNVAQDASYSAVRQRLSSRLMSTLREAEDPRLNDAFDRPPYVEE